MAEETDAKAGLYHMCLNRFFVVEPHAVWQQVPRFPDTGSGTGRPLRGAGRCVSWATPYPLGQSRSLQVGQAQARFDEGVEAVGGQGGAHFGEGALHEAEVEGAYHLAVAYGHFAEGAVA